MADIMRAPKGTFDTLPPDSARFLAVRDALTAPLRRAGYGYVETPIFEDTAVFSRGVGESTDVVSKEMYTFEDRGGRSITLRPELTAGLMRAFIEHRLHTGALPVKLWTVGSAFRYERPQAGRYRHFTQVDMAALGGPDVSGIGYAVGVDRTLLAVQAEGLDVVASAGVQAFVVPLGAEAKRLAVRLVGQLRRAGISADTVYGDRGLKGAMKAADRSGASHAVVIGDRDLAEGVAQLRDLRTHEQVAVPLGELFERVRATVGA